jgi:S1-C subfamily serine protease
MKEIEELSNAFASAVEKAGQSVVRVEARRRLPASGIVWSSDGVIITAHHVVRRDEDIHVGLPGGEKVLAALVGRDPTTDLAVLRAEADGLTPPSWTGREGLHVGHLMMALGRPGQSVRAALGIISALGESWRTPVGGELESYIQTDLVMYPGFSGGLLVGANAKGVGLNTSGLLRGANMAVPFESLQRVVETLLEHGRIRRGYLGVSVQPVRLPAGVAEQLEQKIGLLVVSVEPDSPADESGLVMGDAIVRVDDQVVRQSDDLLALLSGDRVGVEVSMRVVRGGELKDVTAVIGERK